MRLAFWRRAAAPAVVEKSGEGVPAQGSMPTLGAILSASGAVVSQSTAMSVSTVYACVSIRSEDVARCKPTLYRSKTDGSREMVIDHPVARLLRRPNRLQTWFEFVEQMHAALLLRGNAYAVVLRNRAGTPVEMVPVNPDAVIVLEGSDGSIFYSVNRIGLFQIAALRDLPVSIPEEDVIHLRGVAFNMTVGANRLGLAREAVGVAISLLQQLARWMANGARVAGVLEVSKSLTEAAAKRLKASWNSMFSGVENAGSTAVLEDDVKFKPMAFTSVDMEFIGQRKQTKLDILEWFRMPPHKVGVTEGMTKLNLAEANQDYVNNTIMPDLERWEQKLERYFDLDIEGLEIDFDENELLRADIKTRLDIGRAGVLAGLYSAEEWRVSEKLPPKPKYGELRPPLNVSGSGSDVSGKPDPDGGRPSGSPNKEPLEQ